MQTRAACSCKSVMSEWESYVTSVARMLEFVTARRRRIEM